MNTPLLYSKTGVYRGIRYFLIFVLKHILWVLSEAVLTCTHKLCFRANFIIYYYMKIVKKSTEIFHFYSHEKSLYIALACFRNVCLVLSFFSLK